MHFVCALDASAQFNIINRQLFNNDFNALCKKPKHTHEIIRSMPIQSENVPNTYVPSEFASRFSPVKVFLVILQTIVYGFLSERDVNFCSKIRHSNNIHHAIDLR